MYDKVRDVPCIQHLPILRPEVERRDLPPREAEALAIVQVFPEEGVKFVGVECTFDTKPLVWSCLMFHGHI